MHKLCCAQILLTYVQHTHAHTHTTDAQEKLWGAAIACCMHKHCWRTYNIHTHTQNRSPRTVVRALCQGASLAACLTQIKQTISSEWCDIGVWMWMMNDLTSKKNRSKYWERYTCTNTLNKQYSLSYWSSQGLCLRWLWFECESRVRWSGRGAARQCRNTFLLIFLFLERLCMPSWWCRCDEEWLV